MGNNSQKQKKRNAQRHLPIHKIGYYKAHAFIQKGHKKVLNNLSKTISHIPSHQVPFKIDLLFNNQLQILSEKIVKIRVRSAWIRSGWYTGPASLLSGLFTGTAITHWWVQIEGQNNWYSAQLNIDGLHFRKHSSQREVDQFGCVNAGKKKLTKWITTKYEERPKQRTIGQVFQFVKSTRNYYDLGNHNCQQWAIKFYDWI